MNVNENSRNGNQSSPLHVADPPDALSAQSSMGPESAGPKSAEESVFGPRSGFATRANIKAGEGMSKSKLLLLGGGLAIAVLFFVFTAILGRSPKKPALAKQASPQAIQDKPIQPKGSVTPLMETVRTPAQDNSAGQLGPNDIKRTRALDSSSALRGNADLARIQPGNQSTGGTLGAVPSFSDTQQRWEEPQPYGGQPSTPTSQVQQQQNALKESSLIFVRSPAQNQTAAAGNLDSDGDRPLLEITPGTRIQAKLETQISSAVQTPVVAVVEYTYAIGERVILPAGTRVYGQLQQADRSGLVSVKFDEIEVNGAREKIDAIGAGLDLGPIKGVALGTNSGRNFLVRTASGISSVAAMLVGNNNSSSFSEDDLIRERVAQNIGNAGDTEVMSLMTNSRVVVSVPADTKIYVVFTKHLQSTPALHKVAANQ